MDTGLDTGNIQADTIFDEEYPVNERGNPCVCPDISNGQDDPVQHGTSLVIIECGKSTGTR
jgi:hypothetical protein